MKTGYIKIYGKMSGDFAEGYRDGSKVIGRIKLQGCAEELIETQDSRPVEVVLKEALKERGGMKWTA